MTLSAKQKQTYRHREQICGCRGWGRVEGGKDWDFRVSRCKQLYREWINSMILLYSTVNYIQFLVINRNGKEYEKECVL